MRILIVLFGLLIAMPSKASRLPSISRCQKLLEGQLPSISISRNVELRVFIFRYAFTFTTSAEKTNGHLKITRTIEPTGGFAPAKNLIYLSFRDGEAGFRQFIDRGNIPDGDAWLEEDVTRIGQLIGKLLDMTMGEMENPRSDTIVREGSSVKLLSSKEIAIDEHSKEAATYLSDYFERFLAGLRKMPRYL